MNALLSSTRIAASYVALAEAEMFVAEYDVTEDRQARFERALERGRTLVDQALSLDPGNGEAYLARASMSLQGPCGGGNGLSARPGAESKCADGLRGPCGSAVRGPRATR